MERRAVMSRFGISGETLRTFMALAGAIALCLGAIEYFAKAEDLKMVELRLEQKITNDQVLQIQQRMWSLEDRYQGRDCKEWSDERDRSEYRQLRETLDQLRKNQQLLLSPKK